jgi:hypothetical protein
MACSTVCCHAGTQIHLNFYLGEASGGWEEEITHLNVPDEEWDDPNMKDHLPEILRPDEVKENRDSRMTRTRARKDCYKVTNLRKSGLVRGL